MTSFEFVFGMISVITSLALARLLGGCVGLYRHAEHVRFSFRHACWTAMAFMLLLGNWAQFWRFHGTEPPSDHLAHMHTELGRVAGETLTVDHYVDDNMRNIPDHYHAHARPKGGFFGHGFRRS